MIRIERGPVPTIKVFTVQKSKAEDGSLVTRAELERLGAIKFFETIGYFEHDEKKTELNFSFRVYKDGELATALEEIFGNKCAYCESDFGHVTPKDVEHFRPKSEIATAGKTLRPGYYWLAGDWDNLLVSCPDCNRGRKFDLPGQPKKVKLGKTTQFPLAKESRRIRAPRRTMAREEAARLLINPCTEDPSEHLTFTDEGWIVPRTDATGSPSKKGEASIFVYALQRKALVEKRLSALNQFVFQIVQLRDAIANHDDFVSAGNAPGMQRTLGQIDTITGEVKRMLEPTQPYLGILRDWVARQEGAGNLADLKGAGIQLTAFARPPDP